MRNAGFTKDDILSGVNRVKGCVRRRMHLENEPDASDFRRLPRGRGPPAPKPGCSDLILVQSPKTLAYKEPPVQLQVVAATKLPLLIFLCTIARSSCLTLAECGSHARRPQSDDIAVECSTSSLNLAIQICPVIYTGYNDSHLILNRVTGPECRATLDETASPPVARFHFPLNSTYGCGSTFLTTSATGTGDFSDFSKIQTVNVSGIVRSVDPTGGTITYNAELRYYYSCAYPLEYLLNNTQVDVSASSVAIEDKNGSFLSTLTMELFRDAAYLEPLVVPELGLELRTDVYVEVKATNLTGQYHVLLDRCYASVSPLPGNSSVFNLFVPCSRDQLTTVVENGESQSARFHFPAFRFVEQQNQTVSTYYLHCITRLCETSTCATFKQCNNRRRKRELPEVTEPYTITSPLLVTKTELVAAASREEAPPDGASPGLAVAVGVLAFACLLALCVAAVFYKRLGN
ncbi:zona pellucida-like domain-containing protein 1 [Stigmatopora argus]